MRQNVAKVLMVAAVVAAVASGRAEAALTITRPLSPTAGAQDSSAVSKGHAAYDPVNGVYLVVWSNFASYSYGQFVNQAGGNVGVPFRLSPAAAGYANVVWGANGFLVAYNRSSGQRWGRFVTYRNGAPQLTAETYLYLANAADADSGMAYVATTQQYFATYWRYVSGVSQTFLVGLKGGLVNIPETRVSTNGNGYSQDGPDIACDPSRDRCLVVGKAWKDPVSSNPGGSWARFITASTGMPSGNLFYLDYTLGRKEDQRVAFSPVSSRFVVTWVRSRAMIVAKRVYADLTSDATYYTLISGLYGQQALSYNAGTDSFVASFKDGNTVAQNFALELNGNGNPTGTRLQLSAIGTTGDGYPMMVANASNNQFLAMHSVNWRTIYTGLVTATSPGGGTPPPPPPPVTLTSLTTTGALPAPVGVPMVWTAAGAPATGVEYRFRVYDGTAQRWLDLRGYTTSASLTWTPYASGAFDLQVSARAVGSTATAEAVAYSGPFSVLASPHVVTFDRDLLADLTVYRPSNGGWITAMSGGGWRSLRWGVPGDVPVTADYDGDGLLDIAVWRPSNGTWFVAFSSGGWTHLQGWGQPTDIPVPGDYDGDRRADYAVWRPLDGTWHVYRSTGGSASAQWGSSADVPVPGDYDGDGVMDFAVWRPSNGSWFVAYAQGGSDQFDNWGDPGDVPVPADYDGDRKTDVAVWRPSTGTWYVRQSSTGAPLTVGGVGAPGYIPVPADYDGDRKADPASYRATGGLDWLVKFSSTGAVMTYDWGVPGDVPAVR